MRAFCPTRTARWPADQCRDWLRDTLAAVAQRRTGHPAGREFVSPSHRRLTELKMARFGSDYDAVAGLDRFADWLRTRPAGESPPGKDGESPPGQPGIHPAGLHILPDATTATTASTPANGHPARGTNGTSSNGTSSNGHSGPGSTPGNGTAAAAGSYGDPVSALYEQHYASLVRLAALLVRDTTAAEAIVQDSFVAVAAARQRRGNTDGALDFLRQSVLNRSRSALRHGITPAPATGAAPSSPSLLAALGELPARQREVLVLRYYVNLSEEQAADTIGISLAAVRRHATRANATLRTLLDAG
jgi:DNA-directed RNA polymerase specialized sigma24 family protein